MYLVSIQVYAYELRASYAPTEGDDSKIGKYTLPTFKILSLESLDQFTKLHRVTVNYAILIK